MSSNATAPLAAHDATAAAAVAAKPSEWQIIMSDIKAALARAKSFLGMADSAIDAAQPVVGTVLAVVNPAIGAEEAAAVTGLDAVNAVVQSGSPTAAVTNLHNAVTAVEQTVATIQAGGTKPQPGN